jgi:predicted aspartyl protease
MGTFATGCLVLNISDRKRSVRLPSVLVDTGSEATWIPRGALRGIGIGSVKRTSFRMAKGRLIYRDVGYALVSVGRRETVDDVVFAETGDFAILGARALEGLNLWVDAAGKKLVPGRAWPLESVIVGRGRRHAGAALARRHRQRKVALAHSAPANLPVVEHAKPRPKSKGES